MKFLIIGAGLAGLNAAWELTKLGHEVEVLEAGQRVGGRCWSEKLPNGEVIEHGGEFISPNDHLIRKICAEFGLPIVGLGIPFDRRHQVDGIINTIEELNDNKIKLSEAAERLSKNGLRFTLREVAEEAFGADYESNPYIQKTFATTTCDPDRINGIAAARRINSRIGEYLEHSGRVMAGNDSVAKGIHKRIGNVVKFGVAVSKIYQDSSGITAQSADGKTYRADRAVVAVPLPKLKLLIADLDLPPLMRRAIETREMGVAAKLNIAVSGDVPPRGVQAPNAPWWSWSTEAAGGLVQRGALTAYAGGKKTMDSLDLDTGPEKWLDQVKAYRRDLSVSDDYIFTNWENQENAGGAYSHPGIDWEPDMDGAFNSAAGFIAFAGEHTVSGSLNGALASGARAAKLLTLI